MRWAVAFHPDQIAKASNGLRRLMVPPMLIAEACINTARGQGWVVLGLDSDVYPEPNINVQSNPRRHDDDEGEDGA